MALYLALRFCWPRFSLKKIALVALVLSFLDEFSQLLQWPWLVQFRSGTLGHLLLGQGFEWTDLLAYSLGIGLILLLDELMAQKV